MDLKLSIIGPRLVLMLLAFAVGVSMVSAQSGGPYDLTWSTVDGGGYTFGQGGAYTLGGTVGQPDAGLLTGGDYTLGGGFWGGGAVPGLKYRTYLPLLMRSESAQ
jgi:hypothetical protein